MPLSSRMQCFIFLLFILLLILVAITACRTAVVMYDGSKIFVFNVHTVIFRVDHRDLVNKT